MCKGPVDPKELAVICQQSCNKTALYPSKKESHTEIERQENNNVLTLQRILMNACAFCEYGSTQMASCVLGNPAQYQTHDTVLVFIDQALAFQELMYELNGAENKRHLDQNIDLTDFVISSSESEEFIEQGNAEAPEFPWNTCNEIINSEIDSELTDGFVEFPTT